MSDGNGNFFKGLLFGGLIGVIIGILYAPKSGKETREDITRKADELITKAKEEYEKAAEKGKVAYETGVEYLKDMELSAKEKMEKVEGKVSDFAHQSTDILQDSKNRLKKAINAGVKVYQKEKNKKSV